jgi:hypothetical protein
VEASIRVIRVIRGPIFGARSFARFVNSPFACGFAALRPLCLCGRSSRWSGLSIGRKLNARQPDWVEQPTAGRVSLVAECGRSRRKI